MDCGQPPGDGAASRSCLAHIWSQYEAWLFQEKQGPASDSLQKDSDRAVPLNWPEGRQRAAYGSKSKEAKGARQSRCPKAGERSLRIQTGARAAAGNELGLQGLIRNNLFVFWFTTNIFLCLKFKSTDHHIICSILFFLSWELSVSIAFSLSIMCGVVAWVLSRVPLFATPRTVTHQGPLSMEFSREEYWSGLPLPTLGDLPDQRIEPKSLSSRQILHHCEIWEAFLLCVYLYK